MNKKTIANTFARLHVLRRCLPNEAYIESKNHWLITKLDEHSERLASAELAQWIGMGAITEEGRVISITIVEHDARKFIDECVSNLELQRRMLALVS